ncbi:MAG: NUDIX domain-containing protein [Nanoarchaeota archaeon]|nr:NUDIX hydrolase [Nanoarchaeota archaeon]MBU1030988.1 NUDIX hydrolase [Nanoarchaeota archaeon]MBU1849899.1 NUDIX hydrolase [Nanoarchaeota archaeon]
MDYEVKQDIRLTVDIVVFSVINHYLKVLLIKRKYPPFANQFAFPGGFVLDYESLEETARRELLEETGVKNIFMKKLAAYGSVNRDPRGRIVTVVFMALIDSEKYNLKATTDASKVEWVSISEINTLAFDHLQILKDSLLELKYDIQTTNIAAQLLPDKFTLSELQKLYEYILGLKLDKRNFRKKIKALEILKSIDEKKMIGAHRPASLYSFKQTEFSPLKEKMQVLL